MASRMIIPVEFVTLADAARRIGFTYVGLSRRAKTTPEFPPVLKYRGAYVLDRAAWEKYLSTMPPVQHYGRRTVGTTASRVVELERLMKAVATKLGIDVEGLAA